MPVFEPKYLLIVKHKEGLWVRNTPRPQSEGGIGIRKAAVGSSLYAYNIHNINGVPYARLVPQNPTKPEWVRVKEADGSVEYVDVIDLYESASGMVNAIDQLAQAIETLARVLSEK